MLTSCSAEWHLRQAIKKNPKLGDTVVYYKTIIHTDTVHDTVFIPKHDFQFTVNALDGLADSLTLLYTDSFVEIYGKIDSLQNMKFKGRVKDRYIYRDVIVHDSILVEQKCPPNVTIIEGYPKWYLWLFVAIFVGIFLFKILK
jgi:hypothetical protein